MRVEVHLLSQSQPIERNNVVNAYVKAGMYCILLSTNVVEKYPLVNIFRVKEF
jgi:hypothetical protein